MATRRDVLLGEMDKVVPRDRLCVLIELYYPRGREREGGRRPIGLERMLRVHLLQRWYAVSDPGGEEALECPKAMRRFVGLDPGRDGALDESTVLQSTRLPERRGPARQVFAEVSKQLAEHGMKLSRGTLVDATIIAAAPSTRNKAKMRDPGMHQTKRAAACVLKQRPAHPRRLVPTGRHW